MDDTPEEYSASWLTAVIAGLLGIAIVWLYALLFGQFVSPWMGDAARYIEAARSFLRGEALLQHWPAGTAPMRLWPPGYPIIGGLVALAGLPVEDALLFTTRISLALALPAAVWALRPSLGLWLALQTGILLVTAPGLISDANIAGSDAVFVVFVVLTLGCLARQKYLMVGLMAGLALCVRNSGLGLGSAVCLTIVLTERGTREVAERLARVALGGAMPLLGLVVWNALVVGSLTPYAMEPSTRGLVANLTDLSAAQLFDFVPYFVLRQYIPWYIPVGSTVVCIVGVLCTSHTMSRTEGELRRTFTFAAVYIALGLTMTVVARTRYEWGGNIDARYSSQYDWLLPLVVFGIISVRYPSYIGKFRTAYCAVIISILILRMVEAADKLMFYQRTAARVDHIVATGNADQADSHLELRQMFSAYDKMGRLDLLFGKIKSSCLVVSNLDDLLLARYDIAAWERPPEHASSRPMVLIIATLPTNAVGSRLVSPDNDGFVRVHVAGLAPGIRVYSNAPDICISVNGVSSGARD